MATRSAGKSDAALDELLDNVLAEVGPSNISSIGGPVAVRDENPRIYVEAGDLVAQKYLVDALIGEGGMAFVVVATHVKLGEKVALKFLHKEFLEKADLVERFAREAQAASRIKNEHVARVYDVGTLRLKTPPVDAPFLVMEYLEGTDIDIELRNNGPFVVSEAVELTMQACEALAVAHAQGIVHRDIKPENLFLIGSGKLRSVKVLDFGISKLALTGKAFAEAEGSLTGSLTLGTPLYMSPEQVRSTRSVDPRSDIWSLGIVLYEMLTAKTAFEAESVTELCAAVLEATPRPLLEIRPEIPPGLAAIVSRCYEKDPAHRFQNVAELAIALLRYAPKRARLTAERTSQVIRAARPAGGSQHDLDVPSTMPPPSDYQAGMPTPFELRPAPLPAEAREPLDVGVTTVTTRKLEAVRPSSSPPAVMWMAAIALLAFAVVGAAYMTLNKAAVTSAPSVTPTTTAPGVAASTASVGARTDGTPSTAAASAGGNGGNAPATGGGSPTSTEPVRGGTRPVVGHAVQGRPTARPSAATVTPVPTNSGAGVVVTVPAPTASASSGTAVKRHPDLGY